MNEMDWYRYTCPAHHAIYRADGGFCDAISIALVAVE